MLRHRLSVKQKNAILDNHLKGERASTPLTQIELACWGQTNLHFRSQNLRL